MSYLRDVFIGQLVKSAGARLSRTLSHAQTAAIRRPASLPVLPVTLQMRPLALSMASLCRGLLPDSAHLPDGWSGGGGRLLRPSQSAQTHKDHEL